MCFRSVDYSLRFHFYDVAYAACAYDDVGTATVAQCDVCRHSGNVPKDVEGGLLDRALNIYDVWYIHSDSEYTIMCK
jgi:hypothetical protein